MERGISKSTASPIFQFSRSIITAMTMICIKPMMNTSTISWMLPPILETSSWMRSMICPAGVLSIKLMGSRLILSEILMRRLQV